jgi:hypothetical protein
VATRGAFMAHVCCVARLFALQGCISIQISATPSEMGDGLFAASKCSNSTFIILYLYHEMDVGYLVADEVANISKLLDHNCMLSIGANL